MKGSWKRGAWIATLVAAGVSAGCAQDVGDIDRTQPNRVKKSDLDGTWWMHQKVVSVSSTGGSLAGFEGLMMDTDKVVFSAEENYLIAYRSYPILPGSDGDTSKTLEDYDEVYGSDFKGSIRAMFPIQSHFDIQRSYDAATGEQSNVINEDTSDRPWNERDYIRVDWHSNPLINFEWVLYYGIEYELGYQDVEDNDPVKAPYFEYNDDGELVYFDAPATYIVQPDYFDLRANYDNLMFADWHGSTEVRVVTSFAKDLGDRDSLNNYEPAIYDDKDMNRFGFFRSERYTFDPYTGRIMNAGRIELANRHNIWQESYEMDSNGNYVKDVAGNKVSKPFANRKVRTIPYYIYHGASDPDLAAMSRQVIDEWNVTFKRAVYLMQHADDASDPLVASLIPAIRYDELKPLLAGQKDIFVPCEVPVAATDNPVCGEPGYTPREGDFRKNYLWLVSQRLDSGLLGYCPSATDPLTGRTISAQAHIYTAFMNYFANALIDQIRFYKGEYTDENIRENDAGVLRAREAKKNLIDYSKIPSNIRNGNFNTLRARKDIEIKDIKRQEKIRNLRKFDYVAADKKLSELIDSGLFSSDVDSKLMSSVAIKTNTPVDSLSDKARELGSLFHEMSFQKRAALRAAELHLSAKGYCFADVDRMGHDLYAFLAKKYEKRSDYDNIYKEIRAMIFRSTALHEMGHGFGLRHNHTGSYDSMNYFDEYWTLRQQDENFMKDKITTIGDMYKLYDYSDAQLDGGMLDHMYSSIMDYAGAMTSDLQGLGRYDHAAIVYGYSADTFRDASIVSKDACTAVDGTFVNTGAQTYCIRPRKGLVEVFANAPNGTALRMGDSNISGTLGLFPAKVLTHKDTTGTSTFDDSTTVGQNYLELVHYHDMFQPMIKNNYNFLKNRVLVHMDDYLAAKATKSQMIRVPYLFCTDENRGRLRTCYVYDHGADYMEQVLDKKRNYDENYWFAYFARGRAFWEDWSAAGSFGRDFMYLSDFFQNWYIGERNILDDIMGEMDDVVGDMTSLNDQVNQTAIGASFNFLANVIATPEYGHFCRRVDNGQLFGLSTQDETREETSLFYRNSLCGSDPEFFYVRQGDGKRRNSRYDVNAGYDFTMYPVEASHNLVSYMAIRALFDNEAEVISVSSGDYGTYTYGLYDYFQEETIKLANSVYNENYKTHSPRLVTSDGETVDVQGYETLTGELVYPAVATNYFYIEGSDSGVAYDPLTGQSVNDFNALGASVPMFGVCSDDADCVVDGKALSAFCGMLYRDQKQNRCFPYYQNRADVSCPAGTKVDDIGGAFSCVLDDTSDIDGTFDLLSATICSASHPTGYCAYGYNCRNGVCQVIEPLVESSTSLTQKIYMGLFGMFMTGYIGMDSTFYDQYHIYRVGSGETATPPADYFDVVSFEDPFTGNIYAANKLNCDKLGDLPSAQRPAVCRSSNARRVDYNGAAELIDMANEKVRLMNEYYNDYMEKYNAISDDDLNDESSAAYQALTIANYKWYMAKYEVEYAIRDVNYIRSIYDLFARLW